MLTVPPAPGIRPSASSGRPSVASGAAHHVTAERRHLQAAAEHLTVHLGAARRAQPRVSSSSASAGLCRVRARCALAGSTKVPNSARSPPLQNDSPLPPSTTSVTPGSTRATVKASSSAARASVENALWRCGRLNRDVQRVAVAVRLHRVGNLGHAGRSAFGEPAGELGAGLQRRVRQRLGDHPGQRRCRDVDGAQHVVAHRRGHAASVRTAATARSSAAATRRHASPCAGPRNPPRQA